ncbi:DUF2787 family protein [Photobacterium leiognathi]|uniref:DUF2787 family protein n=1 Tax=Photobacterium leiognathi TaxID=553611 RepID=UPI003F73D8F3
MNNQQNVIHLIFRDTSYNAENGRFRPIEIAIIQQSSGEWNIEYITEFAYFGSCIILS